MDRIIGGVLGLCAGIAVVALGAAKGVPVRDGLWRAAVAVLFGYWLGRLIFGPAGLEAVRESRPAAPGAPPAAPEEPKK